MKAPVIRIGMTPEELAEQLVALYADIYAAGDRQTEVPRMLYVVQHGHLLVFQAPDRDVFHEVWKSAAAEGADLLAGCIEAWTLPAGKTLEEYLKEWHVVMNDMSLHPDRREMLCIAAASPTDSWMLASTIDRSGDTVRLERLLSEDASAAVPDLFFSGLPWRPGHEEDEPDGEEDDEGGEA